MITRWIPLVSLVSLLAAVAHAGPPPPPGGHLPLYRGGSHRGGYPQLHITADAPPPATVPRPALAVEPNPFHGSTTLRLALAAGERARMRVLAVDGSLVREFEVSAGAADGRQIQWDGRDRSGRVVPPGLYLVRADAPGRVVRAKVVKLR